MGVREGECGTEMVYICIGAGRGQGDKGREYTSSQLWNCIEPKDPSGERRFLPPPTFPESETVTHPPRPIFSPSRCFACRSISVGAGGHAYLYT